MAGIDPKTMQDLAKLKSANEADEMIRGMSNPGNDQEIKNEFQALKEVEELKDLVEKQSLLLHAFWLLLKEKGLTNEDLDKALNEAVLLGRRTDYKHSSVCPECGKPLQSMENYPFKFKCLYCGTEAIGNPYKKYDDLDPYSSNYQETEETAAAEESAPVSEEDAEASELKEAQDIISRNYEPYDVSKDLNFDDEDV